MHTLAHTMHRQYISEIDHKGDEASITQDRFVLTLQDHHGFQKQKMQKNKTTGRYANALYTVVLEPSEPVNDPEVGNTFKIPSDLLICTTSRSVHVLSTRS